MTTISHPLELGDTVRSVLTAFEERDLVDSLFVFASLARSPEPSELRQSAEASMRESPLSAIFASVQLDREGKVLHRIAGSGVDEPSGSGILLQVAQQESIRRTMVTKGAIEPALNFLSEGFYIFDDVLLPFMKYSPVVPPVLAHTFSRGFTSFFHRDYISAIYILTPVLEEAFRYLLRSQGHDVSNFNLQTQTQQEKTISQIFEQMREELESLFGAALVADFDRVFLSKEGPHLRHSLCHGLMSDGDPYCADAIYGCWLIFRLCMLPLYKHKDEFRSVS